MPHSEEHLLAKSRDYVWNDDFLAQMAKRLKLKNCSNILDVGAGIGHWTKKIAKLVAKNANIYALDQEPQWTQKSLETIPNKKASQNFQFINGNVYNLPFEDNYFDLTTCQTLLLHLANPLLALKEMLRVTKSGGLILLSEPENFKNYFYYDNLNKNRLVEDILAMAKFWILFERGKIIHALGNNSPCSYLLFQLAKLNVTNINIYQNDKVQTLYPPYNTIEQQILIEELKVNLARFSEPEQYQIAQNFYLAGGGNITEFKATLEIIKTDIQKCLKAIEDKEYANVTGLAVNLISAQKL